MAEPSEIAEVLDKAADVIEVRGWCQRTLETGDGRVCMEGAISVACGVLGHPSVGPQYSNALCAVGLHLGNLIPYRWNDAPGRDKYEVIDLLRTVAKELRPSETV